MNSTLNPDILKHNFSKFWK